MYPHPASYGYSAAGWPYGHSGGAGWSAGSYYPGYSYAASSNPLQSHQQQMGWYARSHPRSYQQSPSYYQGHSAPGYNAAPAFGSGFVARPVHGGRRSSRTPRAANRRPAKAPSFDDDDDSTDMTSCASSDLDDTATLDSDTETFFSFDDSENGDGDDDDDDDDTTTASLGDYRRSVPRAPRKASRAPFATHIVLNFESQISIFNSSSSFHSRGPSVAGGIVYNADMASYSSGPCDWATFEVGYSDGRKAKISNLPGFLCPNFPVNVVSMHSLCRAQIYCNDSKTQLFKQGPRGNEHVARIVYYDGFYFISTRFAERDQIPGRFRNLVNSALYYQGS